MYEILSSDLRKYKYVKRSHCHMEDEYLSIAVKQSTMWEINNPRVNSLVRGFYEIVNESVSFSNEQKEEFYFILISLIKIYGNKEWS